MVLIFFKLSSSSHFVGYVKALVQPWTEKKERKKKKNLMNVEIDKKEREGPSQIGLMWRWSRFEKQIVGSDNSIFLVRWNEPTRGAFVWVGQADDVENKTIYRRPCCNDIFSILRWECNALVRGPFDALELVPINIKWNLELPLRLFSNSLRK